MQKQHLWNVNDAVPGQKPLLSGKTVTLLKKMKLHTKGKVRATPSNDMGNAFIWSGFKYYFRQTTDSYIAFSPVKYWKAQHGLKERIEGIL